MQLHCLLNLQECSIEQIYTQREAAEKMHKKYPNLHLVTLNVTHEEYAVVWKNENEPWTEIEKLVP